ncbi:DUF58 domain-containing protein [Halobellus ruber]|uniref:DUF58 domain-containing protein n=1 Tax=Halobellus ruber TaxID=2761102 RepID=A0A7J9SP55_9EURY|nr:DUF58 domain-containing protein [Halobellus ruber]MBB6647091.1 DUF58 domain-containing protein [Halobellus ruber]
MRPTRRGYAVVGVIVAAVAAGAVFGARALDAVVLPGLVALVAAAIQLRGAPQVDVDRTLPPADVAGSSGTVTLELDGDRTYPVTVRDRLPEGVDPETPPRGRGAGGDETVVDAAVDGDPVTYGIVPQRRGEHVVGPATVVATDVLGLLERSTVIDRRDTLVTFPRVGTLPGTLGAELQAAYQSRATTQRDEFDDLREYVRGDSLRDIHWKSSARHDELMVQEFTDRADPERVTVAIGVDEGAGQVGDDGTGDTPADRMAAAAATVSVALVRGGASVTLTTPSGTVDASPGRIRPALRHLAVAAGGRVPAAEADVRVVADGEAVSIRFDGREHRFEGRVGDAVSLREVTEYVDAPPEQAGSGPDDPADAVAGSAATDRGVASDGSGGSASGPERRGVE